MLTITSVSTGSVKATESLATLCPAGIETVGDPLKVTATSVPVTGRRGTTVGVHHCLGDMNIAYDQRLLTEGVGDLHPRRGSANARVQYLPQRLLREIVEACVNRGLLRSDRPGAGPG